MRSKVKSLIIVNLIIVFVVGCRGTESQTSQTSRTSQSSQTSQTSPTTPTSRTGQNHVVGKVFIIDGAGKPLEKIAAIATTNPNAFDEPISRGNLSGSDGISVIEVPKHTKVYIRAWDPILKYFPNNYFEIPPADADYLEDMTIVMLEAGSIELVLLDKDGLPVINENVGLMMFHPKLGPWWPVNSYSDDQGHVKFSPVPPGKYNLRIKSERNIILEIKDVQILPGEEINLGVIKPT